MTNSNLGLTAGPSSQPGIIRRIHMTTQAIVRSIGIGRRSMYIDFALTFVGHVNKYGRRFCASFLEAMAKSRYRKAEELIQRHRRLSEMQ